MAVTARSAKLFLTALAISFTANACTAPSIRPEPFRLVGSWRLLSSLSELPVTDRGDGRVLPNAWEGSASIAVTRDVALRRAVEPPRRLDIQETDSALTVSIAAETRLVLYRDGRAFSNLVSSPGKHECQASWNGVALVVKHSVDAHVHVVETYETLEDEGLLAVTVVFEDARLPRPLTSRRLYRAVEVIARSTDTSP